MIALACHPTTARTRSHIESASHLDTRRNHKKEGDTFPYSLAATVLLNYGLTLGALFGVVLDPICRRVIIEPHFRNTAHHGSVSTFQAAPETEFMMFRAIHGRRHRVQTALCSSD